jgi:hypothetical protein
MLPTLCLVLVGSLARQARAFAFLSFQDTIFAVKNRESRNSWTNPSLSTDLPRGNIELSGLGLNSVRTRKEAILENWDSTASCWTLACEDFDEVMGWSVEPRYPRLLRHRQDQKSRAEAIARALLGKKGVSGEVFNEPEVYSVDLDDDGKEEILADINVKAQGHDFGLVFMYGSTAPQTLAYVRDGWPKILSVAALDDDKYMEVVVGGTTVTGKYVTLWSFRRGKLAVLAHYETPQ